MSLKRQKFQQQQQQQKSKLLPSGRPSTKSSTVNNGIGTIGSTTLNTCHQQLPNIKSAIIGVGNNNNKLLNNKKSIVGGGSRIKSENSASNNKSIIMDSQTQQQQQQMHVCRLCDKILSSSSSLDRHMLTHSGERPFVCKRCHMTFTTNGK